MEGKITFGTVVTFDEGEALILREIVANVIAPANGKSHTRETAPEYMAEVARKYIRMADSLNDQFRRISELMHDDGMPEWQRHSG
jgi:hypothetical protein